MDEKEDGEISDAIEDSFDLTYKPVVRPNEAQYRCVPRQLPSSDEDYSSDSDSDISAIKKRKQNASKMDTSGTGSEPQKGWPPDSQDAMRAFLKPKRRNNIWSTVMEEQVLAQEIGGFGLKRRLDKGDRSVESYDYTQAHKFRDALHESDDDEESEDVKKKRQNRKRHVRDRLGHNKYSEESPRGLADLTVTDETTDEELGLAMADALFESKKDIIVRTVETIGREKALELYKETQEIEKNGGLMILDGTRRRTSGGVFLQLLRKFPGVEKADLNKIFPQDEQWRKRKRAHRRRERHESKPQGEDGAEEGLHLGGLFSDDPGGAKCPGSTPVTSPQPSDNEDDLPSSTINLLPSVMPDQLPTPPPSVADPRVLKPDMLDVFNGDIVTVEPVVDPRSEKTQACVYDDVLLESHAADAMELF
ncbi:phosphorylated adapter RNA export protein [Palaemon carinicauda]|uniref:phosphorylated adapter RNA export protein n=1 Tax=Palaemon carinicauda TaxID=392227 RepID=UPI0035B6701B